MIGLLAFAVVAASGYGTTNFNAYLDGPPPERYHHDTTVILHITDQEHIAEACGAPPDQEHTIVGCGDIPQNIFQWQHPRNVYMLDPCGLTEVYAARLCHELAHTLGWAQDHPR